MSTLASRDDPGPFAALDLPQRPAALAGTGVLLLAIFASAVALPLATYTTALALFGLAHVGSELRYVDYRFGSRLRGGFGLWLGVPLALAFLARLAGLRHWVPDQVSVVTELLLVAFMSAVTIACMRQRRIAAAGLATILFTGAVFAPIETLLILAIAHNFTPLAFLADALTGRTRRRVMLVAMLAFVVLPLVIASGLPYALLARAGLIAPDATLFAGGTLDDNLGAYVPQRWLDTPFAVHIFSAAVFAQCMHYAVVIFVLPRLIGTAAPRRTLLPWPGTARFAIYLTVFCAALAAAFAVDYGFARKVYALAALVHAWIEIPILMLALDRSQPAAAT
jgi:hypothetical protein